MNNNYAAQTFFETKKQKMTNNIRVYTFIRHQAITVTVFLTAGKKIKRERLSADVPFHNLQELYDDAGTGPLFDHLDPAFGTLDTAHLDPGQRIEKLLCDRAHAVHAVCQADFMTMIHDFTDR